MQLEYNKEPAVALQGMMAEPMAPFRNVSRIAEEDIEFADRKELYKLIHELTDHVNNLKESFQLGNAQSTRNRD